MTIALGILAEGGAVIAADRQQSEGTLKLEQGKISGLWVIGRGCIVLSGAGNGAYLDSLTSELKTWFGDKTYAFDPEKFGEELRNRNYDFYERSVMPFVPYEESVDYELLACYAPAPTPQEIALAERLRATPGKGPAFWTSHKLVLTPEDQFAAVGIGATTAKALFTKLWSPSLSLEIATNLAAYIVYQVKRTVKDVGLETDIAVVNRSMVWPLTGSEIDAMEARFKEYGQVERASLYYCLGGDLSQYENVIGEAGEHKRVRTSMHKFFKQLNSKRAQRLNRPTRSVSEM
jgi:hypothetical protein